MALASGADGLDHYARDPARGPRTSIPAPLVVEIGHNRKALERGSRPAVRMSEDDGGKGCVSPPQGRKPLSRVSFRLLFHSKHADSQESPSTGKRGPVLVHEIAVLIARH